MLTVLNSLLEYIIIYVKSTQEATELKCVRLAPVTEMLRCDGVSENYGDATTHTLTHTYGRHQSVIITMYISSSLLQRC